MCFTNVGQSVSDHTGTDGLNWFSGIGPDLSGLPLWSEHTYLSKLRRDSVGADFQSVCKLTNYVCAKPPESRLSAFSNFYKHSGDICVAEVADIKIT